MKYLTLLRPLLPYILAAVLVAGLGWKGYAWAYDRGKTAGERPYIAAIAEAAERYAEAVADQQVTIDDLQEALRRSRTATTATTSRLEATLTHEPESRDWGAVRLPDAIRLLVASDPDAMSGDP